jgi:ribose 5-phosphate isomerase
MSAVADFEHEKRVVARAAADIVESGMIAGLGTGSTVAYLLPALAGACRRVLRGELSRDRARGTRPGDDGD